MTFQGPHGPWNADSFGLAHQSPEHGRTISNTNLFRGLRMLRSSEKFLLGGCSQLRPSSVEISFLGTGVRFQRNLWIIHQPPPCLSRNCTQHRDPDESWSAGTGSHFCMYKGVPAETTGCSLRPVQVQTTWHGNCKWQCIRVTIWPFRNQKHI